MLGLVVIAIFLAYLAVSALVVRLAARWARKRGRRPWVWGGLAALVMYNLVFWDWIPTIVMHKYYCATEAGFWVYKTPEQWAKENPGVLETLKPYPNPRWRSIEIDGEAVDQYNDRFGYLGKIQKLNGPLPLEKSEWAIVDIKDRELIAKSIKFMSGQRGAGVVGKFWLRRDSCGKDSALAVGDAIGRISKQLHMHVQEN